MKSCKSQTGRIIHFAVDVPTIGNDGKEITALFALCGKHPGSRSVTVGYLETSRPINCPSCLRRMEIPEQGKANLTPTGRNPELETEQNEN